MRAVALLLFLAFIPFLPSATSAPATDLSASIWLAGHTSLTRIDPATNQVSQAVPLPYEASDVAVDATRNSVWVLAHKHLLRFDSQTSLTLELDLKLLASDLDDPTALKLDTYDGSLWIAAKKTLLHLDAQGQLLKSWRTTDEIKAVGLALDETLWVATKKSLTHLSTQAVVLQAIDLKGAIKEPKHLAVDSLGGLLWLAGEETLLQYNLKDLAQPPRTITLPALKADDDDRPEVKALALNTYTGMLAIATKRTLVFYDRAATLLNILDLSAQGIHEPEALIFEPLSQNLWLGDHKQVLRLAPTGETLAKIGLAEELEAIGVSAPVVLPVLTLLDPGNGVLTNNALLPARLQLGAECSGSPCDLGQGYFDGFVINASLNGQAIGNAFSLNGNIATYLPTNRLPEGKNAFTAQATDMFSHASNTVAGEFTIDTIPPKFLTITPADNSSLTSQPVTIRGTLDDPAAVVTLDNLAKLGGKALPAPAGEYAFELPLSTGLNVFTLSARDPAGNVATASLRLTLQSFGVKVTNLAPGANVSADTILVSGTFQGPANIGIVVNGVLAEIVGNSFYANNVPLTQGDNTITVTSSTMDAPPVTTSFVIHNIGHSAVLVSRSPGRMAMIDTVAGTGMSGYVGDGGPAKAAQLSFPSAIALDRQGGFYVLDDWRVRYVTATGIISTFAGGGQNTWLNGDGGPALAAQLVSPKRVAVGADGSVYILDGNRVRQIDTNGIIRTVAGNLASGYGGDGGPAAFANFADPQGMVLGPDGSIYIADSGNSCVRKVNPAGIVTTIAGIPGSDGSSGDGGLATAAQLSSPGGMVLAPDGSLYIADGYSSVVRRVDPAGTITTVAGNGVWANTGDNGPAIQASLNAPVDLALGSDGSLYIADVGNSNIRRVSANGIITTVAGTGEYGYAGDGGPPLKAQLGYPNSLALAADGTLFIADSDNYRVRAFNVLWPSGEPSPFLASFRLTYQSITPARIDADFNGDGAVDFSTSDPSTVLQYGYPGPGIYTARFTVTDTAGQAHTAEYTVVIRDAVATDAMLRDVYGQMLVRLKAGNIDSALNAITGGMHEKYSAIFTALQPNLATVVDRLGALQAGTIGDEMAEYVIVRDQAAGKQAFLLYFLRGEDGVWRIDGM